MRRLLIPRKSTRKAKVSRQHHPSHEDDDAGFVILYVIWIAGLIAVLATSFTISVRSTLLTARNSVAGELAQGIADGVVLLTAWNLSTGAHLPAKMTLNGEWQKCSWFGEAQVWISLQDQRGLVDLNTGNPAVLKSLLAGAGLSADSVEILSEEIRDFRDADDNDENGRSEKLAYATKAWGPKNKPFVDPSELDQLPGMTSEILSLLAQYTTALSKQSDVLVNVAPRGLLSLLGQVTPDRTTNATEEPLPENFSIEVAVELKNGSRFVRKANIGRTNQVNRPFAILSWRTRQWEKNIDVDGLTNAACAWETAAIQ